jgi:hypothetical protein
MTRLIRLSDSGKFRLIVSLTILANALFLLNVWSKLDTRASGRNRMQKHQFNDGDIVFRKGRGFVSDLFRSVSMDDPSFSHAGIYIHYNNRDYVMHVRQDEPGPSLIAEPLERFWDLSSCEAGAVYRICELNPVSRMKLRSEILKDLSSGVEFDSEFSLATSERNYCTEWIWRKFGIACPGSVCFRISRAGDFTYIAPDDLYKGSTAELVYHFKSHTP